MLIRNPLRIVDLPPRQVAPFHCSVFPSREDGFEFRKAVLRLAHPEQYPGQKRGTIPPGGSRLALFGFEVPATIRNGSNVCVEMYFGEDRRRPFFNTVGRQSLFCIQKGLTGGLTVLSEKDSQRLIREMKKATRPTGRDRE